MVKTKQQLTTSATDKTQCHSVTQKSLFVS